MEAGLAVACHGEGSGEGSTIVFWVRGQVFFRGILCAKLSAWHDH